MPNSGKLVIFVLLSLGLLAAAASLYYHRQTGRRALELWGTEAALLIASAPRIELLVLHPADVAPASDDAAAGDAIERLGIGGRLYRIGGSTDVSQARGVSNIRHAMTRDATFAWSASPAAPPAWQYGMEFVDGERRVTVLFDLVSGLIGSTANNRVATLRSPAVADWRTFFEEHDAGATQAPPVDAPPVDAPTVDASTEAR